MELVLGQFLNQLVYQSRFWQEIDDGTQTSNRGLEKYIIYNLVSLRDQ